ncbi:MAG: hypothetical protein MUP97_03025 [Acidimicrobiia bacterium]|nr:hypothetical protein [Acidimicrobiia bacterium]
MFRFDPHADEHHEDAFSSYRRLVGVPTVAIDLPGHGASGVPLGDLASDAPAPERVLAPRCAETVTWDTGHSPSSPAPTWSPTWVGLSRQH